MGTNFHGLVESYQFVDSHICRLNNSIIQKNDKFPFCWNRNFMVYHTYKNHEYWHPMNNNTSTVIVETKLLHVPQIILSVHNFEVESKKLYFSVTVRFKKSYNNVLQIAS